MNTCLSVKYLLSFWLRVNTGAECSKEKRVWIVPSIETKGILGQVLTQVF